MNKMKNKKYHNPVEKSIKSGRVKIDTTNTQIRDCLFSCLITGTSIKSGRVKLVYQYKETKSIPLTHKYVTAYFPVLLQALQ